MRAQKTEHELFPGTTLREPVPSRFARASSSGLHDLEVLELDELRKPPSNRGVGNRELLS